MSARNSIRPTFVLADDDGNLMPSTKTTVILNDSMAPDRIRLAVQNSFHGKHKISAKHYDVVFDRVTMDSTNNTTSSAHFDGDFAVFSEEPPAGHTFVFVVHKVDRHASPAATVTVSSSAPAPRTAGATTTSPCKPAPKPIDAASPAPTAGPDQCPRCKTTGNFRLETEYGPACNNCANCQDGRDCPYSTKTVLVCPGCGFKAGRGAFSEREPAPAADTAPGTHRCPSCKAVGDFPLETEDGPDCNNCAGCQDGRQCAYAVRSVVRCPSCALKAEPELFARPAAAQGSNARAPATAAAAGSHHCPACSKVGDFATETAYGPDCDNCANCQDGRVCPYSVKTVVTCPSCGLKSDASRFTR